MRFALSVLILGLLSAPVLAEAVPNHGDVVTEDQLADWWQNNDKPPRLTFGPQKMKQGMVGVFPMPSRDPKYPGYALAFPRKVPDGFVLEIQIREFKPGAKGKASTKTITKNGVKLRTSDPTAVYYVRIDGNNFSEGVVQNFSRGFKVDGEYTYTDADGKRTTIPKLVEIDLEKP